MIVFKINLNFANMIALPLLYSLGISFTIYFIRRLGIPSKFQGMESILQNPIYSTSIGLIEHGFKQMNHEMLAEQNQGFFSKILRIVKSEY